MKRFVEGTWARIIATCLFAGTTVGLAQTDRSASSFDAGGDSSANHHQSQPHVPDGEILPDAPAPKDTQNKLATLP